MNYLTNAPTIYNTPQVILLNAYEDYFEYGCFNIIKENKISNKSILTNVHVSLLTNDLLNILNSNNETIEPIKGETIHPELNGLFIDPLTDTTIYKVYYKDLENTTIKDTYTKFHNNSTFVLEDKANFEDMTIWKLLKYRPICKLVDIMNLNAFTYPSKISKHMFRLLNYNDFYSQIHFCMYYKYQPFNECDWIVSLPLHTENTKLITNLEFENVVNNSTLITDQFPLITITGPTTIEPDDSIILNITAIQYNELINYPITLYLQTDAGYLPKNKIVLENGNGSFKFKSYDLDVGDNVKITVNFKYFSNICEYEIAII